MRCLLTAIQPLVHVESGVGWSISRLVAKPHPVFPLPPGAFPLEAMLKVQLLRFSRRGIDCRLVGTHGRKPQQQPGYLLPAPIRKPPPQSSIRIQTHQSTATGTIAKASTARLWSCSAFIGSAHPQPEQNPRQSGS